MGNERNEGNIILATALAGLAHLVLDGVTSRVPWTTPPYLLLDHASEAFRDLLMVDRTTVFIAVAAISAGINGLIAGLFFLAMASVGRRTLKLGIALSALWLFSGGLMILAYLSPPPGVVIGSLAAGVPRAFAVAWLLGRFVVQAR